MRVLTQDNKSILTVFNIMLEADEDDFDDELRDEVQPCGGVGFGITRLYGDITSNQSAYRVALGVYPSWAYAVAVMQDLCSFFNNNPNGIYDMSSLERELGTYQPAG